MACDRVLVAEADGVLLGVLSLHWTPLLHRDKPLGRITAFVVHEVARGQGIGSRLVAEAERVLQEVGCSAIEVTRRTLGALLFYVCLRGRPIFFWPSGCVLIRYASKSSARMSLRPNKMICGKLPSNTSCLIRESTTPRNFAACGMLKNCSEKSFSPSSTKVS